MNPCMNIHKKQKMRGETIVKLVIVNLLSFFLVVQGARHRRDESFQRLRNRPPSPSHMDQVRQYTVNKINQFWQDLSESNDINEDTMQDIELLKSFQKFNQNFTQLSDTVNKTGFYYISTIWSYAQVDAEMANVNGYYETFIRFQNDHSLDNGMRKPQLAWTDLAETYLQNTEHGLEKSLEKLHLYSATKVDSDTLFQKVLKEIPSTVCNLRQSPQQILYNLYKEIAIADLKGHVMLQFSYMLLKLYNKGNFTVESELAKAKYEERSSQKIVAAREAMQVADRSVYNCDPKQFVERVNYVKLTRLLQGYIENEVNLNPYGTCRENCAYYTYTEYNGCFKDQFCSKQRACKGRVVECRYVDSDMNICRSSDTERRYDWIEYENGRVLGNKGTCQRKDLYKVDSWWRYLFWHCSYCFCFCDESSPDSDRYFNLREVTSDLERNMVVTGVRIVKVNQIIHLQIQQGLLEPKGSVNQTRAHWKAVDNYKITDNDVTPNVDYHKMNWHERAIDIDDAYAPTQHVLTGMRFRKIGTHLNLEIKVSPFDFETGEVSQIGNSYWIGNDNTDASLDKPRTKVELQRPDIPIRTGPNILDSKHDQYVVFQATSDDTDAAQNTVPYFDAQPLTSNGSPLSGMGLIHRGKPGSGGFLAPKLISYDFTPHMIP